MAAPAVHAAAISSGNVVDDRYVQEGVRQPAGEVDEANVGRAGHKNITKRPGAIGTDSAAAAVAAAAAAAASHEAFRRKIIINGSSDLSASPSLPKVTALDGPVKGVSYVPSFLSPAEHDRLLAAIRDLPTQSWTQLSRRRLQTYGGTPNLTQGMWLEELPVWIEDVIERLCAIGIFGCDSGGGVGRANHCLLNEYSPGQGIMPHKDGPLYAPRVAIVSLGATASLEFWSKTPQKGEPSQMQVLCEPTSALVFEGEAYLDYLHGIVERSSDDANRAANRHLLTSIQTATAVDGGSGEQSGKLCSENVPSEVLVERRGTRLSLTIRQVLKIRTGERPVTDAAAFDQRRDFEGFVSQLDEKR